MDQVAMNEKMIALIKNRKFYCQQMVGKNSYGQMLLQSACIGLDNEMAELRARMELVSGISSCID